MGQELTQALLESPCMQKVKKESGGAATCVDESLLRLAVQKAPLATMKYLVNELGAPSLSAVVDADGMSLLHHCARGGGSAKVLEFLLYDGECGKLQESMLDKQDRFGRTALHWATLNGHHAVVKTLVESK